MVAGRCKHKLFPGGRLMKDELGLYYYPNPADHSVRVYVRAGVDGEAEFRLWHADTPEIYERHGWINYAVISAAAGLYKTERNENADPMALYDLAVARALLKGNGA